MLTKIYNKWIYRFLITLSLIVLLASCDTSQNFIADNDRKNELNRRLEAEGVILRNEMDRKVDLFRDRMQYINATIDSSKNLVNDLKNAGVCMSKEKQEEWVDNLPENLNSLVPFHTLGLNLDFGEILVKAIEDKYDNTLDIEAIKSLLEDLYENLDILNETAQDIRKDKIKSLKEIREKFEKLEPNSDFLDEMDESSRMQIYPDIVRDKKKYHEWMHDTSRLIVAAEDRAMNLDQKTKDIESKIQ